MTVLYGSSVADSTLTTACDMATALGGTETSKRTTPTSANFQIAEVLSQGGTSAGVASIPSPTGKGWVYAPGAGTFAAGNWSAAIATADLVNGSVYTIVGTLRFYKYSSGIYTSIGTISSGSLAIPGSRGVVSYPATSMPSVNFAAGDLLYTDLWYNTTPNSVGGAFWDIYESLSAATGVANDMQITTASFTPQLQTVVPNATIYLRSGQATVYVREN
jgi:hypothetical protein